MKYKETDRRRWEYKETVLMHWPYVKLIKVSISNIFCIAASHSIFRLVFDRYGIISHKIKYIRRVDQLRGCQNLLIILIRSSLDWSAEEMRRKEETIRKYAPGNNWFIIDFESLSDDEKKELAGIINNFQE